MSNRFPKSLKIVLLIVILAVSLGAIFGERGIIKAYKLRKERDRIKEKVEKLRKENQYLRQELSSLRNDKRYIEDIARRELGYVREGETVYRFKE